jgi:sulfate/thiosulfate transport system ATP-binding protein
VTTIFVTHDQEEAMEVAEQVVVMNHARIEQAGSPREVYEQPASEFVMRFVGPVAELADGLVRPHDITLRLDPVEGALEAMIERVVHLGFEVRVELTLASNRRLWVQLTRDRAAELELEPGQIVWVQPDRSSALRSNGDSAALPGVGLARELDH